MLKAIRERAKTPGPGKGARQAAHCRPEPRGACANGAAAPVQANHGLPSGSQMKAGSRTTPGDTVASIGVLSAFLFP